MLNFESLDASKHNNALTFASGSPEAETCRRRLREMLKKSRHLGVSTVLTR